MIEYGLLKCSDLSMLNVYNFEIPVHWNIFFAGTNKTKNKIKIGISALNWNDVQTWQFHSPL